jgi:hypothetical protein
MRKRDRFRVQDSASGNVASDQQPALNTAAESDAMAARVKSKVSSAMPHKSNNLLLFHILACEDKVKREPGNNFLALIDCERLRVANCGV